MTLAKIILDALDIRGYARKRFATSPAHKRGFLFGAKAANLEDKK
jgi:hypothetical protein